ncbi:MBL fold metallo-hydrolase [Stenomitos frigidus]|uniref:MBL fold metallo-hydrolase n=1 Tax=Stenomitos frigidus ULC18 TaxID=2107698 RepID=A0A2T1E889_9CYAN|nr:MBL fold metallo-hydrolase [Stenomitos frigidus]PSB28959.1 MBL fold metallo-hydrolase [Stenomitos frigidus ULC18]
MSSDFSPTASPSLPQPSASQTVSTPKQPRLLLRQGSDRSAIFAFPPNRETLGGTAYLIVEAVNILVDCPAWNDVTQNFLQAQGGVHTLFLTHRGGIGQARQIQQALGCQIVMQEQEVYLLPGLTVTPFGQTLTLTPKSYALWTPGHSPGSSCLHHSDYGGVLFSGRHLLPSPQGNLSPLKTPKTFHWRRQLNSVQMLLDQFTPETLQSICPGANIGFLRGRSLVENAYEELGRGKAEG